MLCKACVEALRKARSKEFVTHHADPNSFDVSVKGNCCMCVRLWYHYTDNKAERILALPTLMRGTTYRLLTKDAIELVGLPGQTMILQIFLDVQEENEYGFHAMRVPEFFIEPFHEVGSLVNFSQFGPSTELEDCWSTIEQWISECRKSHKSCQPGSSEKSFAPTRLLDIGVPGSLVRLVDTESLLGLTSYLTLSYSWGPKPIYKLTKSTVAILESGLRESRLPRTYREAFEVVRRYGERYIWIDALCIFQDSKEDWLRESASMHKIYSNGLFNIAATSSSSADDGLFRNRDAKLFAPFNETLDLGKGETLYVFIDEFYWNYGVIEAPLNSRGWVMQERLLCQRVLHFGKDQLFWECREMDACEGFPTGLPQYHTAMINTSRFKGLDADVDGEMLRKWNSGSDQSLNAHRLWKRIVDWYRRCDLTMEEDKLMALSGIAKRFGEKMPHDRYLAGMWSYALPSQLLWSVAFVEAHDKSPCRPKKYRAPSWSWACIDGPGEVPDPSLEGIMITITEAETTPVTGDPTGLLLEGFIRLQGPPLIPVAVVRSSLTVLQNSKYCGVKEFEVMMGGKKLKRCIVSPDVRKEWDNDSHIICYLLVIRKKTRRAGASSTTTHQFEGLMLERQTTARASFRRVGKFSAYDETHKIFQDIIDQNNRPLELYENMNDWSICLV